jgi:hypothetical protein
MIVVHGLDIEVDDLSRCDIANVYRLRRRGVVPTELREFGLNPSQPAVIKPYLNRTFQVAIAAESRRNLA